MVLEHLVPLGGGLPNEVCGRASVVYELIMVEVDEGRVGSFDGRYTCFFNLAVYPAFHC